MRLSLLAAALIAAAPSGNATQFTAASRPVNSAVQAVSAPAGTGALPPQLVSFTLVANDSCSSPTALVGDGPHTFDTAGATTGAQGQIEFLCNYHHSTAIWEDVWFTWTAELSTTYQASLCGGTSFDSRMSIYAGSSCPGSFTSIGCDDDACTLSGPSAVCFQATAGQTYLIQIGGDYPGQNGPGTLRFSPHSPPAPGCVPQDDGSAEEAVGLMYGGELAWLVGSGDGGGATTITSIETCFGSPVYPGGFTPHGPVTVAVWDDPNDDGNPSDGVLLATATATIAPGSIETDVFQSIPLGTSVTVQGYYFVGAVVACLHSEHPGPLSTTIGASCSGGSGSWIVGSNWAPFDYTTLTANNIGPHSVASAFLGGNWLLRATCTTGGPLVTPFCFGDGSGSACPCGNSGSAGNGCANSVNPAGANLSSTGNAIVAADTLVLTGSGMPATGVVLYFQGRTRVSHFFGDGINCTGGSLLRIGTKSNSGGSSSYPGPGDPSISVRGLVPPGARRIYQGWYRNVANYCTTWRFNLTNALDVEWQ